jgi:RimJ/RimL family protein N-acetyltransferase
MAGNRGLNQFGQPIGWPVPSWMPRLMPPRSAMAGRFCSVEPLDLAAHADALHHAYDHDPDGRLTTYLPWGPFAGRAERDAFLASYCLGSDPFFHAIVDAASGQAQGIAAFMRIDRHMGVIEIGGIWLSPLLQRRPAATEAMALMMARAFDELNYRRYEWKCDALNAPSRAAALRLGFHFEGIFRQAVVYKGRNRDTAWFSVTDGEWPLLKQAFQRWLDPANFDAEGCQRRQLASFRAEASG